VGYTVRMSTFTKLQKDLLKLPASEREQLALAAWSSLGGGSDPGISALLDPQGIELAIERDQQLETGSVSAISHSEFLHRTSHDE
jgi:hypothetical protein